LFISAIVLLSFENFSTKTLTIKLSSSSFVKAKTVSESSIFASFKTSSSSQLPLITKELFSSLAMYSAHYKYITEIFTNPYDARKVREKKTGLTVGELKDQGEQLKFNNILLVLVKEGKEWNPYLMYLRGTNYAYWTKQLEENGYDAKSIGLKAIIKADTKKVPTDAGIPAWVLDIKEIKPLETKDLIALKDIVAPAIKEFDKWVRESKDAPVDNKVNSTTPEEDDDVDTKFD
jgi:hypothetical protein